jgi:hypothetical protein
MVAHTDCGAMDSAGSPFGNKDSCLPMAVSMVAKIPPSYPAFSANRKKVLTVVGTSACA